MPASAHSSEYLIGLNNQPRGPFSVDDLMLFARSGVINGQTRVMAQGWDDWIALEKVPELSSVWKAAYGKASGGAKSGSAAESDTEVQAELTTRLNLVQEALQSLTNELNIRTDALQQGQQQALAALVEGQKNLQEAVAAVRQADAARQDALAAQMAEIELRLARAVRDQMAAQDERWSAALNQLALKSSQEMAEAAAQQRQQAEALAKELNSLLPALQEVGKSLAVQLQDLQQSHVASVDELKVIAEQKLAEAASGQRQALENQFAQFSERFAALEKADHALLQRIESDLPLLNATLVSLREATTRDTAAVSERIESLSTALTSRMEAIQSAQVTAQTELKTQSDQEREALAVWLEELQEALTHLRQTQEAQKEQSAHSADRLSTLEKEFTEFSAITRKQSDAYLQHLSNWEALLQDRLRPVIQEIQATPGRLDAQFALLQESVASLLNNLQESKVRSKEESDRLRAELDTIRSQVVERLREAEETALERHSILLASADEGRAAADRIIKHVQETFNLSREDTLALRNELAEQGSRLDSRSGQISAQIEEIQKNVLSRLEQKQETLRGDLEAMRQETQRQVEATSVRLQEMEKNLCERVDQQLAPIQESSRSLLSRSEELSRSLHTLRDEQRESRKAEMEAWQGALDTATQATHRAIRKHQEELQSRLQALQEQSRELESAQQRLEQNVEHQLRSTTEEIAQIMQSRLALIEENQQQLQGLAQVRHQELSQSLFNVAAWSETLHDQIDAAQTGLEERLNRLRQSQEQDTARHLEELRAHLNTTESQLLSALKEMRATLEHEGTKNYEALHSSLRQNVTALENHYRTLAEDLRGVSARILQELSETTGKLENRWENLTVQINAKAEDDQSAREQLAQAQADQFQEVKTVISQLADEFTRGYAAEKGERQAHLRTLESGLLEQRSEMKQALERAESSTLSFLQKLQEESAHRFAEISASLGSWQQQTQAILEAIPDKTFQEMDRSLAARWSLLREELSALQEGLQKQQAAWTGEITRLQAELPVEAAARIQPAVQTVEQRLAALLQHLEHTEKSQSDQAAATRQEISAQVERIRSQLEGAIEKGRHEISEAFLGRLEDVRENLNLLRQQTPEMQRELVQALQDAVAKLPDLLCDAYRISNNQLQKQVAELAVEINTAAQLVEKSHRQLDKAGAEHRALIEETTESSRQQAAHAMRQACAELEKFSRDLLDQLSQWQKEQSKLIALTADLLQQSHVTPPPPPGKSPTAPAAGDKGVKEKDKPTNELSASPRDPASSPSPASPHPQGEKSHRESRNG